jgi:hypothetical protein
MCRQTSWLQRLAAINPISMSIKVDLCIPESLKLAGIA